MSVEKILKAAGESAKGANGGNLKVVDVKKDDKDAVTLTVEVEMPADVIPTQGQATYPQVPPAGGPVPVPPAPGGPVPVPPVRRPFIPVQPIYTGGYQGLNLVDDKGTSLPIRVTSSKQTRKGDVFVMEHTLVYQPEKGQGEPAKLLFSASRIVTVDVAFTLKDVPVK
jgi:hypothetical protein